MTGPKPDPLSTWRHEALGDPTWYSTEPLGHHTSLGLVSSGPVAVLAGFVLAATVSLATAPKPEALDSAALLALALSSMSLFVTLTRVVEANAVYSKPSDRLEWFPEARISKAVLLEQRKRQRCDFARFFYLRRSALRWYPRGAALALLGLALVLLAQADGSHLDLSVSQDTLSDAGAIIGFLVLLGAAGYVLSFMPPSRQARTFVGKSTDKILERLEESRDLKALKGGMRLLSWEPPRFQDRSYAEIVDNLDVGSSEPGNAAMLDEYSPPPKKP